MKYLLFAFSCFLFAQINLNAQHCTWDSSYILILEVRDSLTTERINDLKITLTDSTGKAYTSDWHVFNYKRLNFYTGSDTLRFVQNPKSSKSQIKKLKALPFAVHEYILMVYANNYFSHSPNNGTDLIKIEDIDEDKNGGFYKTVFIPFSLDDVQFLCQDQPIWKDNEVIDPQYAIQIRLLNKYYSQDSSSCQEQDQNSSDGESSYGQ